jgi:hypothetical protein
VGRWTSHSLCGREFQEGMETRSAGSDFWRMKSAESDFFTGQEAIIVEIELCEDWLCADESIGGCNLIPTPSTPFVEDRRRAPPPPPPPPRDVQQSESHAISNPDFGSAAPPPSANPIKQYQGLPPSRPPGCPLVRGQVVTYLAISGRGMEVAFE